MKVKDLFELLGAVPEAVGQTLKAERERRGWSQHRLAAEMTEVGQGWHQTTVAKTEAGTRPLKLTEAVALVTVLKLGTLDNLFGDDRFRNAMWWALIDEMRAERERRSAEIRTLLAREKPERLSEYDAAMERVQQEIADKSTESQGQLDHVAELIKILESESLLPRRTEKDSEE